MRVKRKTAAPRISRLVRMLNHRNALNIWKQELPEYY
jgi:hypothetical protein